MALGLFDVHSPLAVAADRVHAQSDDSAVTFLKFRLQRGHVAEFRGAHRGKVFGMREQDRPAVADPFMEVDGSLRSFRGEIGGIVVYAQHRLYPGVVFFRAGTLESSFGFSKSRTA